MSRTRSDLDSAQQATTLPGHLVARPLTMARPLPEADRAWSATSRSVVPALLAVLLIVPGCASHTALSPAADYDLRITPFPFNSDRFGNERPMEIGRFLVPAIRDGRARSSETFEVGYVRYLRAEDAPDRTYVFVNGGRTDTIGHQTLFSDLRQFGDVVVLDPRGTGLSVPEEPCHQTVTYPMAEPLDQFLLSEAMRRQASACFAEMAPTGAGANAYAFAEIAADIVDLQNVLGAKETILIAENEFIVPIEMLMHRHPERFAGAALVNPSWIHGSLLDEIELRLSARGGAQLSEVAARIREVERFLEELQRRPVPVQVESPSGRPLLVTVGPVDVAFLLSLAVVRPDRSLQAALDAIESAERGEFRELAELALEVRSEISSPVASVLLAASNGFSGLQRATENASNFALFWPWSAFPATLERMAAASEGATTATPGILVLDTLPSAAPGYEPGRASGTVVFPGGGMFLLDEHPEARSALLRFLSGVPQVPQAQHIE